MCATAYPGVGVERAGQAWRVVVPQSYHVGHEAHFAQVAAQFLRYVGKRRAARRGRCPDMIAKYRDDHARARDGRATIRAVPS